MKKTAYAQSSQIRQIRKKMVEIMSREASSCDLKELVGKFIPEAIGAAHPLFLLGPYHQGRLAGCTVWMQANKVQQPAS